MCVFHTLLYFWTDLFSIITISDETSHCLSSNPKTRPAPTLGPAASSRPTTSELTRPRPLFSWALLPVAPCLACRRLPPNISVSPRMRFPMTCPCPRGGRWPRRPLGRDTSSSEYTLATSVDTPLLPDAPSSGKPGSFFQQVDLVCFVGNGRVDLSGGKVFLLIYSTWSPQPAPWTPLCPSGTTLHSDGGSVMQIFVFTKNLITINV